MDIHHSSPEFTIERGAAHQKDKQRHQVGHPYFEKYIKGWQTSQVPDLGNSSCGILPCPWALGPREPQFVVGALHLPGLAQVKAADGADTEALKLSAQARGIGTQLRGQQLPIEGVGVKYHGYRGWFIGVHRVHRGYNYGHDLLRWG